MPLVRFLGFPTGSSVSLAASQGAETARVTIAPWNVARRQEDLSIAMTRAAPAFRRAPEAVWFEAMPSGFEGLTPVAEVPAPPGPADWENGPGLYAGFSGAAAPETDKPALVKIASVEAGPAPSGVLFEAGGPGGGFAAAFDATGALVVAAGDGAATKQGPGAPFVTIDAAYFTGGPRDIWIGLDPATWRMRVFVVDAATQRILAAPVADAPEGDGGAAAALFANGEKGLWLDLTDPDTLAANPDGTGPVSDGGTVGHVADKSGNGFNAIQADPARRPVWRSGAGLAFDGIDDFLELAGTALGMLNGAAGVTIAAAIEPALADAAERAVFFASVAGGDGTRAYLHVRPDAYLTGGRRLDSDGWDGLAAGTPGTQLHTVVAEIDHGATQFRLRRDGAEIGSAGSKHGTGSTSATNSKRIRLGESSAGGNAFQGTIREIVVVDRILTQQEMAALEAYLGGVVVGSRWADAGGVGVGQGNGEPRAGVAATAFTGTMGPVSIWGDTLPEGFGEDRPHRYEPEFHEIFYEWDFGDPGATYTALQNAPAAFKDANRAIGKLACHVYQAPGTYTATCTARQIKSVDPLTFVEVSQSVQVSVGARLDGPTEGDPVWDGWTTIVLSEDGEFAGAPTGQHLVYGGALRDAIRDAYANGGALADGTRAIRVLLKRGEGAGAPVAGDWFRGDWMWDDAAHVGGAFDHVFIGTWGEGANPVMLETHGRDWGDIPHTLIVDRIDVRGTLDHLARDYAGADAFHDGQYWTDVVPGQVQLFNRCSIADKWDIGFRIYQPDGATLDPANPALFVVNDCACDGVTDYAVFGSVGKTGGRGALRAAILGLRAVHPANAPRYTIGTGPGLARKNHGPIRLTGEGDLVIDGGDFFSRLGWTAAPPWPDGTPRVSAQPGIRLTGDGVAGVTSHSGRVQVTRVSFEGDNQLLSASALETDPTLTKNILVDSNFVLSAAGREGTGFAGCEGGAVTVRNNLLVVPQIAGAGPLSVARGYAMKPRHGVSLADIEAEPVADYGNSVLFLATQDAALDDVTLTGDVKVYTVSGNVVYAPNVPGQIGHVDIAPFDATALFAGRDAGRWEGVLDAGLRSEYAMPAGAASLYAPLAGSPVAGAATAGYVSLFDIVGTPRWPRATLGAVEAGQE